MQNDQNKKRQQDTPAAKRRNTLIAIIFLLLLGFLANRFLPDTGEEAGQNDYAADVTVTQAPTVTGAMEDDAEVEILYQFRKAEYLEQHFEKHGEEFDYATKEEYLAGANRVIQSPDALHKLEAEDGDDVYYLEETNEFVIVSKDGYIRTYFRPSAGIDYYNRQ